jgi:hypothetical protein
MFPSRRIKEGATAAAAERIQDIGLHFSAANKLTGRQCCHLGRNLLCLIFTRRGAFQDVFLKYLLSPNTQTGSIKGPV